MKAAATQPVRDRAARALSASLSRVRADALARARAHTLEGGPGISAGAVAGALARGLLAALVLVLAVAAGLGWLYLLRDAHVVHVGPRVTGALPLQRLAGQDRQPLLRVLLAWTPDAAGAAAALAAGTRLGRVARALVAGAGSFTLLFVTGAASDAVTASDPIGPHVAPQLGHAATWIAAVLFAAGALIPRSPARRRDPSATPAAATRSAGSAPAAAGRTPRPA
jgi:hypothetical protein